MALLKKYLSIAVIVILLQSCSLAEDTTNSLLRQARDLEFADKIVEAENTYMKIDILKNKEVSQRQLGVLMNLARFYLKTKNYNKSIIVCQKALTVCEHLYGPHAQLADSILFLEAYAYEGLTEYDKAAEIFNYLVKVGASSSHNKELKMFVPLVKLGDIEFEKHNLSKAIKIYQKAGTVRPIPLSLARLLNYRLALCCSLQLDIDPDKYLKYALPQQALDVAPYGLISTYAQLLKSYGKFGSAALAFERSRQWGADRKAYLQWLYARSSPSSRDRTMAKYIEEDYDAVKNMSQANKENKEQ